MNQGREEERMIDWKNVPEAFKPRHMRKREPKAMKQIKTNNAEHTATPWDIQNKGNLYGNNARVEIVQGINKDGSKNLCKIARMRDLTLESYANAEFICRAVNAHDELVEALKRMKRMWEMMMEKVDHGASFYDADTIREMNEAPLDANKYF